MKISEKLATGKWNGTIYANNTIYISDEKIENVDIAEIWNYEVEAYKKGLPETKRENYEKIIRTIDMQYLNSKTYKQVYHKIAGVAFNYAKEFKGNDTIEKINNMFVNLLKIERIIPR